MLVKKLVNAAQLHWTSYFPKARGPMMNQVFRDGQIQIEVSREEKVYGKVEDCVGA